MKQPSGTIKIENSLLEEILGLEKGSIVRISIDHADNSIRILHTDKEFEATPIFDRSPKIRLPINPEDFRCIIGNPSDVD